MKIALACDHGAYEYKELIKKMLSEEGHEIEACRRFPTSESTPTGII